MEQINKRERLINAAAALFHKKGMAATSLADIAKDAEIPIGNVYYYFKTKEELALSALLLYKDQYIALFTDLNETIDDPRARLHKAIAYFASKSEEYTLHGCPVGKMVLDHEGECGAIAKAASDVLQCFLGWAEAQFSELGHGEEAKEHAAKLLCGLQGGVLLAKAMQERHLMLSELTRLSEFVEQLPNKRIVLGKVGLKAGAV